MKIQSCAQAVTSRRYLLAMVCWLGIGLAGSASINALIDPYGLIEVSLRNRPSKGWLATADRGRLVKPYLARSLQPRTLLLGSSITSYGMDPRSSEWLGSQQPVFNLGINGASPHEQAASLAQVLATTKPSLIVLPLLFEDALFDRKSSDPVRDEPEPGSIDRHWREARDVLSIFMSARATYDSARTILLSDSDGVDRVRADGFATGGQFQAWLAEGAAALFAVKRTERVASFNRGIGDPLASMAAIRSIVKLARGAGAAVVVLFAPAHIEITELRKVMHVERLHNEWRRQVTIAVREAAGEDPAPAKVLIWDFASPSIYTTESVLQTDQPERQLAWFYDPVHFKPSLGALMISRLNGGGPPGFGSIVSEATIDAISAEAQARLTTWEDNHKSEVASLNLLVGQRRDGRSSEADTGDQADRW